MDVVDGDADTQPDAGPALPRPWPRRVPRVLLITTAAVLLGVVGVTIWLVPGSGRTQTAAAALLAHAQSSTLQVPAGQGLHFLLTAHYDYVSPSLLNGSSATPGDMAIEAWVKQGRTHVVEHVAIKTGGTSLTLVLGDTTYWLYLPTQDQVVTGAFEASVFDALDKQLLNLAGASHQQIVGQEEINGHHSTKLTFDATVPQSSGAGGVVSNLGLQPGSTMKGTAWIDTATKQLVREAMEIADAQGHTLMQFTVDMTVFETVAADALQPDLFDFVIPDGARVTHQPLKLAGQ